MRRLATALFVLIALTAFAPAPFPKHGRRDTGPTVISQELFQGRWKVISFDIYQQGGERQKSSLVELVHVQGDRWAMCNGNSENASYAMVIDGSKRPATIDFYSVAKGQPNGTDSA